MDKEQIERAQNFAVKYIKENPVESNDTWVDFEDRDLHFYFDEPEYPAECGVWAYPVETDGEGYRTTNTDSWVKILNYDLTNA